MNFFVLLLVGVAGISALPDISLEHNHETRIIGGTQVTPGEFPSQLSLRVEGRHVCGASIISTNWALTAAHCVRLPNREDVKPSQLTFLAGTVNLDGTNGGTVHQATDIIVHEKYDPLNWWINDIAVIKVSDAFPINDKTVAVGKLPAFGQTAPDGSEATVIGWGSTVIGGGASPKLLKASLSIVNRKACEDDYSSFLVTIYSSQICAGVPEGGKGSCNMDSGGPLFVSGEVVGLVSWAYGCAVKNYPTVYTSVAQHRDWITNQTGI
ncbi:trypsin-1 [Anabrus simplex]|uniref:trypsin-1 n=1 Tax=Anabrus simplex TaxID=316456 RepID=UPI0035A39311